MTSANAQSPRVEIHRLVLASVLLVLGAALGLNIAPDYYDCGRLGLVITLLVGILGSYGVLRWARAPRPMSTALFCVVPWSLGLAGLAYLGFLFLLLEVIATFVVLRRNTALRGIWLLFASIGIRIVALLPVLLGKLRIALAVTLVLTFTACMPPSWGAGALLHPSRHWVTTRPMRPVQELDLEGEGVKLRAWWFRGEGQRRGTVVYLHGVAANRGSSVGVADHLVPRGFDVLAYDGRAHGDSTGDACTYGFYEKRDLMRVLERVDAKPIVLIGSSLGGAVALQAAAIDERVSAVVAIATFSDLRTVAYERAPFIASKKNIEDAFKLAEHEGAFRVDDVSPVAAAESIRVPVFLVHGAEDDETPPDHSRRVLAALRSHGKLLLVPGARHNTALTAATWRAIETWLDGIVPSPSNASADLQRSGKAVPRW